MNDNKKQFTWIPFYEELAQKLLPYRYDRTSLLSFIYSKREELQVNYLHDQEGTNDLCPDIDPFTFMGIFNRGIKTESRFHIAKLMAGFLKVKAVTPSDFEGIPLLNNQMSHFFGFRNKRGKYDIENLWQLFEDVILNKTIEDSYNRVIKQYIINVNITMGLFWIKPNEYLAFDSKNRTYLLKEYGITLPTNVPEFKEYKEILNAIKAKMASGEIKEETLYEISSNAFTANYESTNNKQTTFTQKDEEDTKPVYMYNKQYDKYIDLLKANHNIIFNGAPGTGKTYLAKEIAEAMGAKYKMVQFHPSYDYTDFVEGLRPVKDDNGNIGFERKDGVFKEFCAEAQTNLEKASKTIDVLQKEQDISKRLDAFITDAIENEREMETDRTKNKFTIIDQTERNIIINVPKNEKVKEVKVSKAEILKALLEKPTLHSVSELQEIFQRHYGSQQDSYIYVICTLLKKQPKNVQKVIVEQVKHQDYVFIIDEINRGEISKIFGELFFSIDPGYRGTKGLVQTQYQNLVEEGDVFKDGFYVPENVYIIGTMNDIDRSVESMDFAMRRRFAWQEITAEESAENMGITGELRERMDSLNQVIKEAEGLGSSYQVGAAMFKKVKDTEVNVEENCGMTADSLWNLNLKSLMKEYLRGLPEADDALQKMEDAYFLKKKAGETGTKETSEKE